MISALKAVCGESFGTNSHGWSGLCVQQAGWYDEAFGSSGLGLDSQVCYCYAVCDMAERRQEEIRMRI